MTSIEFQQLVEEVRQGETEGFSQSILLEHYDYVHQWVKRQFRCSEDDARSITLTAFFKLLARLKKDPILEYNNLRGYLITTARNSYFKTAQPLKNPLWDLNTIEYYLGKQEQLYHDNFDPLLQKEQTADLNTLQQKKLEARNQAWKKLGEPCQKLLKAYYSGVRLKDLQEPLGYASYDAVKSTKSRCMGQLKKWANQLLNELTN